MVKRWMILIGLSALVAVGFQNCGQPVPFEGVATEKHLNDMWAKVVNSVGMRCEVATDCQQAAVGHRTCGGPSVYLIYSSSDTNVDELSMLIEQYNQLQVRINEEHELIDTCDMVLPYSSLACENNQCQGRSEFSL